MPHALVRLLAILTLLLSTCASAVPAQTTPPVRMPTEQEIKVALLYKFAKFVNWPKDAHANATTFRICILGGRPFGEALNALNGKEVNGLPLELVRARSLSQAKGSHIVYVDKSWSDRLETVVRDIGGLGVLFIGSDTGFAKQGGVLEFTLQDGRVGFAINLDAAGRERLEVSSKLLRLAQIVQGE